MDGATSGGGSLTTTSGMPTTVPTSITQARTTREPSMRLEREEQRVAAAHSAAAPSPPRMAVTLEVWRLRRRLVRVDGGQRTGEAGGRAVIPSAFAPGTHPRAAAPIDTSDPY